jgi:opacity protein-like surface antigen
MKLTSQTIIALCLSLMFCGQARAEHIGPYVGAFIGGNALMDAESTDDQGSFSLKFKPALLGSAVIGWDFEPGNPVGEGRIELEYSRRSNTLDQVKFAEGSFSGGGKVTADSLLLNFWGVFHNNKLWAPYVGVGIGAARMEASNLQVTGQPLASGTPVVFAYQLGAGVDLSLTKNLSLDLGYRFFGSTRPKFTEPNGSKFAMDYYSHNVLLGLRVGF